MTLLIRPNIDGPTDNSGGKTMLRADDKSQLTPTRRKRRCTLRITCKLQDASNFYLFSM